jgi:hypothetical protein
LSFAVVQACSQADPAPAPEGRSEAATTATTEAQAKPFCDAFAGVCASRASVKEHGCGGSAVAVDAEGWCASIEEVCCAVFAP